MWSSNFLSKLNVVAVGIVVVLVLVTDVANGISPLQATDGPTISEKIGGNRTILVDVAGNGEFKTIQDAIDSIPEGNKEWVIVHIRKGVYREKISIPETKPYIFLRGNGKGRTHVIWDDTSLNNTDSATLNVEAANFIAFGISFRNEANIGLPWSDQISKRSVAVMVGGDKAAFYHCGFFSTHNTLFDNKGRHYYENCYFQGSVDFIFGRAKSTFFNCEVFVVADKRVEISGSITAQNRHSEEENSGFVFLQGRVYGIGGVYLGRPRGPYSRVIFAKTYLSKTIVPKGWTDWRYDGETSNVLFAEYDTHGPGADVEGRAPWSKQLKKEEAAQYMSIDFIDGKEWLPVYNEVVDI